MSAAIAVILVAFSTSVALAQVSDVKGSKDHPMVSRYAGSIIIGYDFRKFDEFVIPLGPAQTARGGKEHIRAFEESTRRRTGHAHSLRWPAGPFPTRNRAELRDGAEEERVRSSVYVRRGAVRREGRLARNLLFLPGRQATESDAAASIPAARQGRFPNMPSARQSTSDTWR